MMQPGDIARHIYKEIGLAEPTVQEYPSVEQVIADFPHWKRLAFPLTATYWDYQYPILKPSCFWERFRLYHEGLEFDLTRTADEHGALIHPHYKSKKQIPPLEMMFHPYLMAALDAAQRNPLNKVDHAISRIRGSNSEFFDELQDMFDQENPASPVHVTSYTLLSGFSWLCIERDILTSLRTWLNKPLCDEHYRNVRLLCDSHVLFFTFGRLILWAPLQYSPDDLAGPG